MNKLTFLESKIIKEVRSSMEVKNKKTGKKSNKGITVQDIVIVIASNLVIINPGGVTEQCRKFEAFPNASKHLQEYKRLSLIQLTSSN